MTEYAKDLSPNFRRYGDVTNVEAINQSIENLIFTHPTERLFTSIGSSVSTLVFRMMSQSKIEEIKTELYRLIKSYIITIKLDTLNIDVVFISKTRELYIQIQYDTLDYETGQYSVKQEIK